jgi:hypothetical protein
VPNATPPAATPKITTKELAARAGFIKPESIHAAVCRKGHWLGLRPIKLPNHRLLWDAAEAARALSGGAA